MSAGVRRRHHLPVTLPHSVSQAQSSKWQVPSEPNRTLEIIHMPQGDLVMHALTSTIPALGVRRNLAQHLLKKRPLLMGGGGGAGGDSGLLHNSHSFHSSAPSLGGGTPGEWNHVWNWKIKKRLATMEEEGNKLKNQNQGGSSSSSSGNGGEGFGPLPGEKVIALDENLPDGALEAYWAELRREREVQRGGGGEGGGEEKEKSGKAKRSTIKRHLLFGWNYAPKKNKGGAGSGEEKAAAGGKRGALFPTKAPAPGPAATAAAMASTAGK